jgi:hypothetical protein
MIVKMPPKKGDLPLLEHITLNDLYKSSLNLANKCFRMEDRLLAKERKLSMLQLKRDLTLRQLQRIASLIPRTSGAMQHVLVAEQKELQLRLDYTLTPQLLALQPKVEDLRKDFAAHERELKWTLKMMQEAIDRWKQIDALNDGDYTEEMKARIQRHEMKHGPLRTPEDYSLPGTHLDVLPAAEN